MYPRIHIRVYTQMYTHISDRICDEQTKVSNSPAWTAPAASSTIFFGFFVSLSLTVTVTPLQVMFLTVELSRCLSATDCCSGSVLIPTGGGSGFSQPIACWAMSVSTYFIRPFFPPSSSHEKQNEQNSEYTLLGKRKRGFGQEAGKTPALCIGSAKLVGETQAVGRDPGGPVSNICSAMSGLVRRLVYDVEEGGEMSEIRKLLLLGHWYNVAARESALFIYMRSAIHPSTQTPSF